MSFTTLKFIVFFTILFFTYYAIPKKFQWWLLLLASYGFYAAASPIFIVYLMIVTAVTYSGALIVDANLTKQKLFLKTDGKALSRDEKRAYKAKEEKKRKLVLLGVCTIILGMLGVFKYATFALQNFSWLLGIFGVTTRNIVLDIALPIGLSFYVFQSLGYYIDVYREEISAERNFLKYNLFTAFFPQVLQGPIGNYGRLAPQLVDSHDFDYKSAVFGLQRIAWGFFKKLVVANQISLIVSGPFADPSNTHGFLAWSLCLFLYSIQLYADFSGYMDIAIGCSEMLGIKLDENFDTPYFSESIAEFWRRWHITLGVWFKNYLFYPLLRSDWISVVHKHIHNKQLANTIPTAIALAIVWLLIGLWHGADWCYVLYGIYHGSFIIAAVLLGDSVYAKISSRFPHFVNSTFCKGLRILRTFIIVTYGYVLFVPASLENSLTIINDMCNIGDFKQFKSLISGNLQELLVAWMMSSLLLLIDSFRAFHCHEDKRVIRQIISNNNAFVRIALYLMVLLLIIFCGVYNQPGLDQFAYFKF